MTPPYASPRSGALPRELPRELLTGTATSTRPRLDSQHSLAVPSGEELLAAARAAALRATTDSPKKRRPRRGGIPRLLMAVTAACVLVAAVIAGVVALRAATPPDRSTALATIAGYFDALKARDFNQAWQFVAQSRSSNTAQASFVNGLTSDDARYGRVLTYSITQIEAGNSGQASAQVEVTRVQAPTQPMTYAVVLTQYGGNTWLINSVSTA
jgi:hypothetical protein